MDTFSRNNYFDPLWYALGGNIKRLQAFVDAVLEEQNELDIAGFTWSPDLLEDFTYEQVEKYVGIAPLAPVYDPDSPAVPFSQKGNVVGTGSIPRMKTVDYFNERKLRMLKKLTRRNDVSAARIQETAGEGIGELFISRTNSFKNAISFQRNQMVSKGGIDYDSTNNPYGIALSLSARIPSANEKTLKQAYRWWTSYDSSTGVYSSEGASCDPIGDLKKMVEVARQQGCVNCHFEINNSYLDQVLNHSVVKQALKDRISLTLKYSVASTDLFNRDELIQALSQLVGKPVIAKDGISLVEYVENGEVKERTFDSFEKNVIALVPDQIGEILAVEPLLLNGGNYAFALGGRLAFTIDDDYANKCQGYYGELTALAVPSKPRWMWRLHPYGTN